MGESNTIVSAKTYDYVSKLITCTTKLYKLDKQENFKLILSCIYETVHASVFKNKTFILIL